MTFSICILTLQATIFLADELLISSLSECFDRQQYKYPVAWLLGFINNQEINKACCLMTRKDSQIGFYKQKAIIKGKDDRTCGLVHALYILPIHQPEDPLSLDLYFKNETYL